MVELGYLSFARIFTGDGAAFVKVSANSAGVVGKVNVGL